MTRLSQGELAALKKQLGLSPVDANHGQFQVAGGSGLLLSHYFRWAEVRSAVLRVLCAVVCRFSHERTPFGLDRENS